MLRIRKWVLDLLCSMKIHFWKLKAIGLRECPNCQKLQFRWIGPDGEFHWLGSDDKE